MYVDRSLCAKKDNLIDELKLKKCMQLKRLLKSKFFVGITNKQREYIIHPDFLVGNHKIRRNDTFSFFVCNTNEELAFQ